MKIQLLRDLPAYREGLVFELKADLWQGDPSYYGWWFNGAPLAEDGYMYKLLTTHAEIGIDTRWFKEI